MISGGMTTKEIAAKFFISVPTVETHRQTSWRRLAAEMLRAGEGSTVTVG
jgi:DNA-binding CsgD family transcriptional regulator